MIEATPAKLRDGSWGTRVKGDVRAGDTITVRTKGGKSWSTTVDNVISSGRGGTLCSTRKRACRMGSGHGTAAPVAGYAQYCTDRMDCRCYDCAS